jgi:hypothetical protein
MGIETGGSGQGETPKVPQAPETTQPDQAALGKQAKMRAYKREYNQKWRKEHPDRAKELGRESARRQRQTEHGKEYSRNYKRGWLKRQKEAKRASARAAEQWGTLPRLNPIFELLSEDLYKQQTSPAGETAIFPKPVEKFETPQSPTPERPRSTRARRNP